MLKQLWKGVRAGLLGFGVLLGFFAAMELVRSYQVLRSLHPVAGHLFFAGLLLSIAWAAFLYVRMIVRRPMILTPPVRIAPDAATAADWRTYCRYLARVMKRLGVNPRLPPDHRDALQREIDGMKAVRRSRAGRTALAAAARRAESAAVEPALEVLDALGEREVRTSVRDVMLGVTLSPWHSVDLLVVVYRNLRMVSRVIAIYNARPRMREQLLVFKDVVAVVATVNYLNYGSKLSHNLLAAVPGLGRFTDDVAQGAGAGLLTSVAGHSARQRCRDFRGWNRMEAQRTIVSTLNQFMSDVKGIMLDQVVPRMNLAFMDRMRHGIGVAMAETAKGADAMVRMPISVAGKGLVSTGNAVGTTFRRGGGMAWDGMTAAGRHTGQAVDWGLRTGGRGAVRVGRGVVRNARKGVERLRKAAYGIRATNQEGDDT